MKKNDEFWLEILRFNKGFDIPEQWVDFARHYNFQKVKADKIYHCPDCGHDIYSTFGRYIYYSTLINIKRCEKCGLLFSDTRIDPNIIAQHFENTYKDEQYFSTQRRPIFEYISKLVNIYGPSNGNILDIGGGKGHLLSIINRKRSDLKLAMNDLSLKSCDYVKNQCGFETFCCTISNLSQLSKRFDVILLIDVIYLEPDIRKMWDVIAKLLNDNGTLIIRVPNKINIIKFYQKLTMIVRRKNIESAINNMKYYNPEHIYIFTKQYLINRLYKLGFSKVSIRPSPLLIKRNNVSIISQIYFYITQIIYLLSYKKIILTPSMIIVANRG